MNMNTKRCTVCKDKLSDNRSLQTIADEDSQLEQALYGVLEWNSIPTGFYMCLRCRQNLWTSWEYKQISIQTPKATEETNAGEQKEENSELKEEEKVSPEVKTDDCSDMGTEGKSNTSLNAGPSSVRANPDDAE